jgi:hypothetical protein
LNVPVSLRVHFGEKVDARKGLTVAAAGVFHRHRGFLSAAPAWSAVYRGTVLLLSAFHHHFGFRRVLHGMASGYQAVAF